MHKQKSLEHKLEEIITKTEISSEEVAEVRERIKKLNNEIYDKEKVTELDKTGITNIDDMLKYMQDECIIYICYSFTSYFAFTFTSCYSFCIDCCFIFIYLEWFFIS